MNIVKGEYEGAGKKYKENGTVEFEGNYNKGKKHGQGMSFKSWNDGTAEKYTGEFVQDKRQGKGKCEITLKNKQVCKFDGEWN